MLIEAEKRQRERGIAVWLVGLTLEVLRVIQRSPLGTRLGRECMHFNLETAIAKYQDEARTHATGDRWWLLRGPMDSKRFRSRTDCDCNQNSGEQQT